MISLIEALNYRCLRYVRQPLGPFHVMVGPNASGKSTFLDVVAFLRDLTTRGLAEAVELRTSNFYDLVWRGDGDGFELAVELPIPESLRESLDDDSWTTVRYEVAVRLEAGFNRFEVAPEHAFLKGQSQSSPMATVAPSETLREQGMLASDGALSPHCLFARYCDSAGRLVGQTRTTRPVPTMDMYLPGGATLLGTLPPQWEMIHPISRWLRSQLVESVERLELDPLELRGPSPHGQGRELGGGGGNLPWVVERLQQDSPERFRQWIEHLQTALPTLAAIRTVMREEDRHRYLMLEYNDGLEVPSWSVSDGTLRLLALTLSAYLPAFQGILLIEEPENGLHPLAIETMYQSLSSVYDGQVLLASHSPMLVATARPSEVLCFTSTPDRGTQVVAGDRHPQLSDWRGEVDLGTLFASGVLG